MHQIELIHLFSRNCIENNYFFTALGAMKTIIRLQFFVFF